ncbi:hypothetical protein [Hymenobacter terrenus]|nr:hypothetical protein [Hymenobacter terrenus]
MGDKSQFLAAKAAEYAQSLGTLMPQYLDVVAFLIDSSVNSNLSHF